MENHRHALRALALKRRFFLSDAEVEIVLGLIGGLALPEIALARGVTHHTARSQLKSIFQKTGARSQVQLVTLTLGES